MTLPRMYWVRQSPAKHCQEGDKRRCAGCRRRDAIAPPAVHLAAPARRAERAVGKHGAGRGVGAGGGAGGCRGLHAARDLRAQQQRVRHVDEGQVACGDGKDASVTVSSACHRGDRHVTWPRLLPIYVPGTKAWGWGQHQVSHRPRGCVCGTVPMFWPRLQCCSSKLAGAALGRSLSPLWQLLMSAAAGGGSSRLQLP